jgi:competence protein ComGF
MNTIVDNVIGIFCIFISLVIIVFLLTFSKKSKNKKVDNWFIFLFLIMIGLCLLMIYQDSKFSRQASSDIYLVKKMQVEVNTFKNYEKRIPILYFFIFFIY